MPEPPSDVLARYLEHLDARVRAAAGRTTALDEEENLANLPDEFSALCKKDPRTCLALIIRALEDASTAFVAAIGSELLAKLLNENAAAIRAEVGHQLRTSPSFRQAFSNGLYSSIDPDVIAEWLAIFKEIRSAKEH
jgi:sugar-specific transcriptional regulator TrmB